VGVGGGVRRGGGGGGRPPPPTTSTPFLARKGAGGWSERVFQHPVSERVTLANHSLAYLFTAQVVTPIFWIPFPAADNSIKLPPRSTYY